MRILGAGVIVSAMLLASTAEADTDWYILGRDGCKVAHEDFMKNPGVFILGLKHLGRAYTVDDRRDEGGQIVASIVTDEFEWSARPLFSRPSPM